MTPAHQGQVNGIFDLLTEFGVKRYALLVVPQWHGGWLLEDHKDFVGELLEHQQSGAEIFLHGFRHDEDGLRRPLAARLKALGRTAGEGEFLLLDPREASRRVDRGLEMLFACGLSVAGFVPPAWLHGTDSFRMLNERGLSITEDVSSIIDTASRRRITVPTVRWSTRKAWRGVASVAIAWGRLRRRAGSQVLRLAIHPSDVEVPYVLRSLRRALVTLLSQRSPISYQELLFGSAEE